MTTATGYEIRSEARGAHWIAWVSRDGSGKPGPLALADSRIAARADLTIAVSLSGADPHGREAEPVVAVAEEEPVEEWSDRFRRSAAQLLQLGLLQEPRSRQAHRAAVGRDGPREAQEAGLADREDPRRRRGAADHRLQCGEHLLGPQAQGDPAAGEQHLQRLASRRRMA